MTVDQLNAFFEFAGSFFVAASVRAAWRDKAVAGVSWASPAFFFIWGLWNLIYYPSLGQWWSLAGGICLSAMNGVWIAQLIFYRRCQARHPEQLAGPARSAAANRAGSP